MRVADLWIVASLTKIVGQAVSALSSDPELRASDDQTPTIPRETVGSGVLTNEWTSSQFGQVQTASVRAETSPLGQSGGAGLLARSARGETAIRDEVVVNGGMHGSEFLEAMLSPELEHPSLPSSSRLM